jgi:hypothetical protein
MMRVGSLSTAASSLAHLSSLNFILSALSFVVGWVVKRGGVIAEFFLVSCQIVKLVVRIPLETAVGIKFDHPSEGKRAIKLFVGTACVY